MMTCEDCQREAMEFIAVAEGHIVCRECAKAYFEVVDKKRCEKCKAIDARYYLVLYEFFKNSPVWHGVGLLCTSCAQSEIDATEISKEEALGMLELERHVAEDAANISELEKCLDEWGME